MHVAGPVLAEEAKALPADLAAFLDQGVNAHAAVYVSMSTLARSNEAELP